LSTYFIYLKKKSFQEDTSKSIFFFFITLVLKRKILRETNNFTFKINLVVILI